MQHVPKKWLEIFNLGLLALDIFFVVMFAVFRNSAYAQNEWGVKTSVLVLVVVHILYLSVVYRLLKKRFFWLSNIISFAIYGAIFSTIIEASGNTNLVYRLGYAALIFSTALSGVFLPIAAVILTWIVLLFSVLDGVNDTNASLTFNLIIDAVVTIAAIGGWAIFHRHYLKDKEVVSLSGKLAKEQTKSTVVLEYITDGVVIVNPKGITELINVSAATMFGWSKQEATNLHYQSLYTIGDDKGEDKDVIGRVLTSSQPAQALIKLQSRHGKQLYVDVVASPMFEDVYIEDQAKTSQRLVGVIAVYRDVDQQKREEQERTNFISTASHEMRTPVATIQGFLELSLTPKVFNDPATLQTYLRRALDRTQQLGQLFQDLLTVSRSDDGRLSFSTEPVDIRKIAAEAIAQLQPKAEAKHLSVVIDDPDPITDGKQVAPLIFAQADPKRLIEVLLNLIDNAIKYTPEGSVKVQILSQDKKALIKIADTGNGIAEEDIPHLFQKFYRVDNSATREVGGSGLGLYICRQMIEQMQGRILVESKLDVGSTFTIELPLSSSPAPAATPSGDNASGSPS